MEPAGPESSPRRSVISEVPPLRDRRADVSGACARRHRTIAPVQADLVDPGDRATAYVGNSRSSRALGVQRQGDGDARQRYLAANPVPLTVRLLPPVHYHSANSCTRGVAIAAAPPVTISGIRNDAAYRAEVRRTLRRAVTHPAARRSRSAASRVRACPSGPGTAPPQPDLADRRADEFVALGPDDTFALGDGCPAARISDVDAMPADVILRDALGLGRKSAASLLIVEPFRSQKDLHLARVPRLSARGVRFDDFRFSDRMNSAVGLGSLSLGGGGSLHPTSSNARQWAPPRGKAPARRERNSN